MASDDSHNQRSSRRRLREGDDTEDERRRKRSHRTGEDHSSDDRERHRRHERLQNSNRLGQAESHTSRRDRLDEDDRKQRLSRYVSPRDKTRRRERIEHGASPSSLGQELNEGGFREHGGHDTAGRRVAQQGRPLPSQEESFALTKGEQVDKPKEKPNLGTTGHLASASNSVVQADGTTVTLKYHEPPEARKPSPRDEWKLFVFKGPDIIDTIELSSRSCWLVGREAAIVDLLAEHPSVSKQHAVIQFRYTEKRNEFGDKVGRVKPYLVDLESANGTTLNNEKVPDRRYLELRDKDMIQFGLSTREYVLMLAPKD
ncbi:Smad nuclear-interacting protein [Pleurostoma richardsiae]|uniref:Smad nuclear-interacting protein n=1 Tax=Pleurostoma richardsiae TaxID=41990 RepID=A0AA38RI76_9PEZI|nr:Smad nuclear-interacting protein [Pleurostoma richardsiae]